MPFHAVLLYADLVQNVGVQVFQITSRQKRPVFRGTAIAFCACLVTGVIAVLTRSGELAAIAAACGLVGFIYLYCAVG